MAELEGVWVYINADLLVMRPLPAYSINGCECQEQSNTYWSLVRLRVQQLLPPWIDFCHLTANDKTAEVILTKL